MAQNRKKQRAQAKTKAAAAPPKPPEPAPPPVIKGPAVTPKKPKIRRARYVRPQRDGVAEAPITPLPTPKLTTLAGRVFGQAVPKAYVKPGPVEPPEPNRR